MTAPIDNLVRLDVGQPIELRSAGDGDGGDGNTMFGEFAVFDRWTEIDSWFEGRFLERISKGAFRSTFKERRDQIRVLYDHGADPMIGNKPLGEPRTLRETDTGAYFEVDLFDASYVNDLKPALRAGQLGASFRFKVTKEQWVEPKTESAHNPAKLPERTITGVDLYEFGPVTFPAYADASAGLRSRSDEFIDRLLDDPKFLARLAERTSPRVVQHVLADATAHGHVGKPTEAAHGHEAGTRGKSLTAVRTQLLTMKGTR